MNINFVFDLSVWEKEDLVDEFFILVCNLKNIIVWMYGF